ncbi:MAG TPA: DUF3108 domain-containing protein [Candidatus Saccharimonadales bacterium]|nr:DUF3108 domain-containing protein [Candidatus Saccharimonadales bacterium]
MSHRTTVGIATIVALGCLGGAFYWLHGRSEQPRPEVVTASSATAPGVPEERSTPVARQPAVAPSDAPAAKEPPPPDPGLPLRSGEVLEYSASIAKLNNVANLRLQVNEKRSFQGKNVWHMQAFAHTENPLRMVFVLDDQFDSYSDATSMASVQYEMHLSERGQKVDSIQRMTTTGREPAPAGATVTRVFPGTRDPLGMMQYLRNVDWGKTPEVRGPVYDGHKLYEARARRASSGEPVSVPAGQFITAKIDLRVFENGAEMKDAHFSLYLADDAAHTPVLLEATLPFAVARVELVKRK